MRYALLLSLLLLAGCPSNPQPNFEQALGASYLLVDGVAQGVFDACEAEAPGAPCAPDALIETEQRDKARAALVEALALLDDARTLWNAGSVDMAQDKLTAARSAIAVAKEMVRE